MSAPPASEKKFPDAAPESDLFAAARLCLTASAPEDKVARAFSMADAFARGTARACDDAPPPEPICSPGRPARPRLVAPRDLPKRGLGSIQGRVAFLHAIAHIEFNAIDLACDAVYRFRGMPQAFYADWVQVAADEARHFSLLSARMATLGCAYGDHDAHNGLWEMAESTADSCLARMALVPRVLEARGLDVTPAMITRLRAVDDDASAEILELILREEVAHVAAGSRWFRWCCAQQQRDPDRTFGELMGTVRGALRGPFNLDARQAAGFAPAEMAMLHALAAADR
jgi:uncharacterized ferritin-like protein (DUF455 family)